MLQENNPLAWASIYDKYAPAIYGLICKLTDDQLVAEKIFITAFVQLRASGTLTKITYALYGILLRHTYSCATEYLKQAGIIPKILDSSKESRLFHLLATKCNFLKEAESILAISVKET